MQGRFFRFSFLVILIVSTPAIADEEFVSDIRLMNSVDMADETELLRARQLFEQFSLLSLDIIGCRQDEETTGESCNRFLEGFEHAYPVFRPLMSYWKGRNHHYKGEFAQALAAYDQFLGEYPELLWMGRLLSLDAYNDKSAIHILRGDLQSALETMDELILHLREDPARTTDLARARLKKAGILYAVPEHRGEAMGLFQNLLEGGDLTPVQADWLEDLYLTELWLQSRDPVFVLPGDLEQAVNALLDYRESPGWLEQLVADPQRLHPITYPEGDRLSTTVTLEQSVAMVRDSVLPLVVDWDSIVRRGINAIVRVCQSDGTVPGDLLFTLTPGAQSQPPATGCELHNFRATRAGWSYQGLIVATPYGDTTEETLDNGVFLTEAEQEPFEAVGQVPAPAADKALKFAYAGDTGICLQEGRTDLGCDWVDNLKLWPSKVHNYSKSQVDQFGTDTAAIAGYNKDGKPFSYARVSIENECHLKGTGIGCNKQMGYDRAADSAQGRNPVLNYKLRRPRKVRPLDTMKFKLPFAEKTGQSAGGLSLSRELSGLGLWGTAPSDMTIDSLYRAIDYGLCNDKGTINSKDCAKRVCGDWGGGALYNSTGIYKDAYFNLLISALLGPFGTNIALSNGNELPLFATHYFTGRSEELFAVDFSRSARNDQGSMVRACRGEPVLASQDGFVTDVKRDVLSGNGECNADDAIYAFTHCVNRSDTDANYVELEHLPLNEAILCLATGKHLHCSKDDYETHYYHLMGGSYRASNPGPHTHWKTGNIVKNGGVTVETGMFVRQGARLGLCDDTGISAIDHLHFKIRSKVIGLPSVLTKAYYDNWAREVGTPAQTASKGAPPGFLSKHSVPQLLEGELLLYPGQCVVSSNKEAVATRCAADFDCPTGQFCSVANRQLGDPYAYAWCTPYCLHHSQCPDWNLCERTPGAGFGTCGRPDACLSEGDCPAGMRCGTDSWYGSGRICLGECELNKECGDGATDQDKYEDAKNRFCDLDVSGAARAYLLQVNTRLSARTNRPQRDPVNSCRALKRRGPGIPYTECSVSSQCPRSSKCITVTKAQWAAGRGRPLFNPVNQLSPWKPEYRNLELTTPGEERGVCVALPDRDGDWVFDDQDNCPDVANPLQEDVDGNGTGDACDSTMTVELNLQDHCAPPQDFFLGGIYYSFQNYAFAAHAGQSTVWGLPAEENLKFHFHFDYQNFEADPFMMLVFSYCEGNCQIHDQGKFRVWFNYLLPPSKGAWIDTPDGKALDARETRRNLICPDRTFCDPLQSVGKTYTVKVDFLPSHNQYLEHSHPNETIKLGTYAIVDPAINPWPDCPGGGIGEGMTGPASPVAAPP